MMMMMMMMIATTKQAIDRDLGTIARGIKKNAFNAKKVLAIGFEIPYILSCRVGIPDSATT